MVKLKNKLLNSNIIFTSKTDSLIFLQKKIKFSQIEKIYAFTVNDWNHNRIEILDNIKKKFNTNIIIRSSAIGEDSPESSQAGTFSSFLNISPSSSKKIKSAINSIIKSYLDKGNTSIQNQIHVRRNP